MDQREDLTRLYKEVSNKEVIQFFRKKRKIRRRIRKIFMGKVPSSRYDLLFTKKTKDFGAYAPIVQLGNITFLKEKKGHDDRILRAAKKIAKKGIPQYQETVHPSEFSKYLVIPETIVYYLERKFNLSTADANKMYIHCSDLGQK